MKVRTSWEDARETWKIACATAADSSRVEPSRAEVGRRWQAKASAALAAYLRSHHCASSPDKTDPDETTTNERASPQTRFRRDHASLRISSTAVA